MLVICCCASRNKKGGAVSDKPVQPAAEDAPPAGEGKAEALRTEAQASKDETKAPDVEAKLEPGASDLAAVPTLFRETTESVAAAQSEQGFATKSDPIAIHPGEPIAARVPSRGATNKPWCGTCCAPAHREPFEENVGPAPSQGIVP